ncbi:hypothetical protein PCL_10993 [Purpureocillium lilacinum]|uniref:Uncharacterized protein n=1 Tax=Purpureocillium lilacinum TaxID=33203 RepID=A0A2U3ED36_PURLI|nr:hypothetical protein PCL_10993 [Purpureocillium lilacinum]
MSTLYREVVAPKRASSISDAKAAWARAVCVVLMRANGAASTAEKGSIRELSALKLRVQHLLKTYEILTEAEPHSVASTRQTFRPAAAVEWSQLLRAKGCSRCGAIMMPPYAVRAVTSSAPVARDATNARGK